jgi:hypothetical protein
MRVDVVPVCDESPLKIEDDPLWKMAELAVDMGIPDLSVNIDHYLYGHPKVTDNPRSFAGQ